MWIAWKSPRIVALHILSLANYLDFCESTGLMPNGHQPPLDKMNEIQGTHFHDKRIHSNIHYHSEFKVVKMRIVGQSNRENLLAAITACKALTDKPQQITMF